MSYYVLEAPLSTETRAYTYTFTADPANFGPGYVCPRCGKMPSGLEWQPPYRLEVEFGGKAWADIVMQGKMVVSQRLKDLIHEHQIVGFEGFNEVELVRSRRYGAGRHVSEAPPRYYYVTVKRSRAAVDRRRSGVRPRKLCVCPECRYTGVDRIDRLVLEPEPVPTEDVFVARGLYGTKIASEKFKWLCDEYAIDNVILIPAEEYSWKPLG